ncbi:MAG: porin [Gammaproteobacteria bacterium]|nr:porin [Gammaproteobacteria bacterium]
MKKTIIAMTIAAAAAAPMAANAAATVYGKLQAEISSIDDGTTSSVQLTDKSMSRLGVKASEELGNGMTMLGKMEFKLDSTTGTISAGSRLMYVGLKSGMGTFMMGSLKSPYKYTGGIKYDAFVATTLEARGTTMTGGTLGHNGFQDETIGFNMMGGKLSVTYGIDENTDQAGDIAIGYKHKMGKKNEIVFAHISHDQDLVASGTSPADYSSTKIGGKFGAIKGQVELIDKNGVDGTNIFVAYSMKAAGGQVVVQGGQSDSDSHVDPVVDVTVAYIKKFTKGARWFAGARSTTGGIAAADDADNTVVTYGVRYDF